MDHRSGAYVGRCLEAHEMFSTSSLLPRLSMQSLMAGQARFEMREATIMGAGV
jgi:hypothetical protein